MEDESSVRKQATKDVRHLGADVVDLVSVDARDPMPGTDGGAGKRLLAHDLNLHISPASTRASKATWTPSPEPVLRRLILLIV